MNELTPTNEHEEMLVMALLRKARGEPIEYSNNGEYFADHHGNTISISGIIYRKTVKKLDIPWQHIDDKWNYAAMDDDNSVRFFDTKPNVGLLGVWYGDGDRCKSPLKIDTEGITSETSLTKRP